jgi:hypothetical protein
MKSVFSKLFIYLAGLIVMGMLGFIYSMALAGIGWGISLDAAPETAFKFLGGLICPSGSELRYSLSADRAASPATASYTVDCVFEDGTMQANMNAYASKMVFTAFFLVIFLPTFIAGAILMGLFLLR